MTIQSLKQVKEKRIKLVKEARSTLEMTQQELADLLGVTQRTINSYEGGKKYSKAYAVLFEALAQHPKRTVRLINAAL